MRTEEAWASFTIRDFIAMEMNLNCSVKYSGLEVVYCSHSHDAGVRCPNGELQLHGLLLRLTV